MPDNNILAANAATLEQPPAAPQAVPSSQTVVDSTGTVPLYGESLLASPLSAWVVPSVLGVLIVFSIATWASLLIKGWQFNRFTRQNKRFAKHFWAAADLAAGEALAHQNPSSLARLVQVGTEVLSGNDVKATGNTLSRQINRAERVERRLSQQIQLERRGLESGLALLASIGSTAPFIGLFGTVWGIMEALVHIGATGQASLGTVAGPIGHALIATGIGIAAAVPAVLVYNYFVRRLKLATGDLELFADTFYSLAQENNYTLSQHDEDQAVDFLDPQHNPRFVGQKA
ncbi:MotA/TolQ/ExbB proton channel family protein [Biostraticola tofi]|uniref:Outer membrane transport energization protein ExbB n=1 Tax=Biostraticola tofi TaxID=466109 RepID=A0A4R3Z212_9GAMM|nr:MotA/TolQ/ExbB proton channel family protein [Biostraticola tofi]TCV98947.1 outer membrane transport energization protein ExbB [Biostraticola tofi]